MVRVRIRNRVSIRVRDGFGFEFSGFSVSTIQNYFLRATLQLCVNSQEPLKFSSPWLGSLNLTLTLTLTGQQLRNMTPCSDNAILLT